MKSQESRRPGWIAVLGVCTFLAPGGLALAQQPPAEKPPADKALVDKPEAEPGPPKLREEITVTAQKREENVQEVPLSVTTLDADQMLDPRPTGGADVKALSARVPSLLLESSFGRAFPRFYIRGLGNTDFDLNASQPVSMIVDEVVLENPIVKGMPLFDLDRIEVLRGPQGTLFGRNTPAGIVKFDTAQAVPGLRRASRGLLRHLQQRRRRGGGRRRPDRHAVGARLGAVPVAVRLDRQHASPARTTPSAATRPRPTACSSSGSRARSSRPCSTSTAGTSTAPRASSAPTSSRRAPTIWSTASSRTRSSTRTA